ncbi:uncharacterized protein J4E84_004961 [Alternaria hordeiaustralica]|uniref:uncharacterized protein n=1 Tax=Alternaria hordeiaustralica TaxID=1187925 RepID=UPI0020C4FCCB|nr:uncharacterized protein J4E84_004961 [Alternaria hordeiaustralica]KAI4688033.1 hypothetical protein J4E84_004961 [Alternaria hordeiaustralica]
MSQPSPTSAITPTDEATYNYLKKLSAIFFTPDDHQVFIGRHQPRNAVEPFRCVILGISDDNELRFETAPQEGRTRPEAMMKTIELLETKAQTVMARVEGKNASWVLAREMAKKKMREREEEVRKKRAEAWVMKEQEARLERLEEAGAKAEEVETEADVGDRNPGLELYYTVVHES